MQRKETRVAEAEAKTLGLVRLRAAQTNGPRGTGRGSPGLGSSAGTKTGPLMQAATETILESTRPSEKLHTQVGDVIISRT